MGISNKGIPENQAEIIVCDNNFHGRTTTIISFSSEQHYRQDFGPFTPGFVIVPFGDIAALEELSLLIPPLSWWNLSRPKPESFSRPRISEKSQSDCAKPMKRSFIADEIQTGLGRTGKMFACEYEDVMPDILVIGKVIEWRILSRICGSFTREILGLFTAGSHGSTFSGNPLGSAVAREALHLLQEEGMVENAAQMGEYFLKKLSSLKKPLYPGREGTGLLLALELIALRPEEPGATVKLWIRQGLLCKETHGQRHTFCASSDHQKAGSGLGAQTYQKGLQRVRLSPLPMNFFYQAALISMEGHHA